MRKACSWRNSPYEYSAFLAKYEDVIEASKAYLTHVDDVKAEKGRNSKTQIRQKGLVEQALEKAQDAKEKTRLNYRGMERKHGRKNAADRAVKDETGFYERLRERQKELIKLAKSGNAKKLLQEYVISLADARKKTPVKKAARTLQGKNDHA